MTDDTGLPPFPGNEGEDEAEEKSNVSYLPGTGQAAPAPIGQQRQERASQEIIDLVLSHRGDVATIGGIIRRFEVERLLGPITEEEFVYITSMVTAHTLTALTPILSLLVAEGHKQFTD